MKIWYMVMVLRAFQDAYILRVQNRLIAVVRTIVFVKIGMAHTIAP
jgi:hypothetical protein